MDLTNQTGTKRRPLIGITPGLTSDEDSLTISRDTTDAILTAGGIPVILPTTSDEEELRAILRSLDGLIFSGGGDVNPLYFHEYQHMACGNISPVRDEMELPLARLAYEESRIPVLGICRGCQVLNIALGGDVWQDLPGECPTVTILHRQKCPSRCPSHPVTVTKGSLLHRILGQTELMVNSMHHQAVRKPAAPFTVTAKSPDEVNEAIEAADRPFFLGLQWHPERLWRVDEASRRIFLAFVEAATAR